MLIPRNVLEVHRIASTDENRPNLTCVHAEREADRPRLTATDGHRLVTVTWNEPEIDPGDVPADYGDLTTVPGFAANVLTETCSEIARAVPSGDRDVIYHHAWLEEANGNGLVRMGAGDKSICQAVQCEAKDPEIEFPNWREVVAGVKGAVRIGINAKYLAEILRVVSKASGEVGVVLSVPADPTQLIGIHADSADGTVHVDAVLAPMRLDLTGRPDWDDVPTFKGMEPPPDEAAPATGEAAPPKTRTRKAPLMINVHVDRPCTECGSKGTTTDSGFCLDCIGKKMRDPLFRNRARRHAEAASRAEREN